MRANPPLAINHIVLSCIDLVQTERWFREGLGLEPEGGKTLTPGTPFADDAFASPRAEAVCWSMIARNPGFRIELLQFSEPLPRLQPSDFRPCDIGYTRIGVHVSDFPRALDDLARMGSRPVGPILGSPGERRASVRNPDGLFVEIMERDPLPHTPREHEEYPAVRSVTVSTPDLAASIAHFCALTGKEPNAIRLHENTDEALWGLKGARCRRAVLDGGDLLIELVQYTDPAGKPRPEDYRVSDAGIISIGFSASSAEAYEESYREGISLGLVTRARLEAAEGNAAYLTDPFGFSTELAFCKEGANHVCASGSAGGRPTPAEYEVVSKIIIGALWDQVWAALNDHTRMHRWIEADTFEVIKHGTPDSAGYGAERVLTTLGRRVVQQIVRVVPGSIGYRAIAGTPFSYHNGTIEVREDEGGTRVIWTIRYRTMDPALGPMVYDQLQRGIPHQLEALKSMIEEDSPAHDGALKEL